MLFFKQPVTFFVVFFVLLFHYQAAFILFMFSRTHISITNKCIGKMTPQKNLPSPLFAKEGQFPSLWQREVRRDFIIGCLHTYELPSK